MTDEDDDLFAASPRWLRSFIVAVGGVGRLIKRRSCELLFVVVVVAMDCCRRGRRWSCETKKKELQLCPSCYDGCG